VASTKLSRSCFVSGAVPVTTDSDSHPWSQAIWEACEAAVAVTHGDGMCAWPRRRVGDSRVLLGVESSASLIERLLVPAGQVENVTGVVEKGGKKADGR
jgi:phosphoribosylformylglycinamidine (FGAM) synthase-like amidotransferase family enzyme